ncbi:Klc, partial [Symbiodinium sp. CCMP2456]
KKYTRKSLTAELRTFCYASRDGPVHVWQHALNLQDEDSSEVIVLYHYSNELCFQNVANLEQTTAELFASLVEGRAHFGQGVYTTQYEPSVWGSRKRILLNNYSNGDPWRKNTTDEESRKVLRDWGDENTCGNRAACCIPMIVPRDMAFSIFERQTPDLQARGVPLGTDSKGREVHRNRDVWVVRFSDDGGVRNAVAKTDGILDLLQLRLGKLQENPRSKEQDTTDCMLEVARRLRGRGRYQETEQLYRDCLARCQAKKGITSHDALVTANNLAGTLQDQGKLDEAEPLYRECLKHRRAKLGNCHVSTLTNMSNLASLLTDRGQWDEAESLRRECLKATRSKLGDLHPNTLNSLHGLAGLLMLRQRMDEAEPLYRECLAGCQNKLGDLHPITLLCMQDTLTSMANLGGVLQKRGRLDQVEILYRECLQKRRATLGD